MMLVSGSNPEAETRAHLRGHGHTAGQDVFRQQVRAAVHAAAAVVVTLDLGTCTGANPALGSSFQHTTLSVWGGEYLRGRAQCLQPLETQYPTLIRASGDISLIPPLRARTAAAQIFWTMQLRILPSSIQTGPCICLGNVGSGVQRWFCPAGLVRAQHAQQACAGHPLSSPRRLQSTMAPWLTENSKASTPAEASGSVSARPGSLVPLSLPAASVMSWSIAVCVRRSKQRARARVRV